jgi:murein L,D-transpeptidase YafK
VEGFMRGSIAFASGLLLVVAGVQARAMSIMPTDIAKDKAPSRLTQSEQHEYDSLFADRVVVKKADRRLYLIKGQKPFRSYRISLGPNPDGRKRYKGDGRTPEGRYVLDWRTENTKFWKALHISYPNAADRMRAELAGRNPGGMVMVHGQPTGGGDVALQQLVSQWDWTQGCIAVSDMAIDEIWSYTRDGTPIDILP